jgi:DNA primase
MAQLAPEGAVDQIKARLNIVEVIQQNVPLRRRGRDWWGLCPFHEEKTPSFKVNEQQQQWYCFGCQRGGDMFSFVQETEKLDFRSALELLAERAGVELKQRSGFEGRQAELKRRLLDLNGLAARYYAHVLLAAPAGELGRHFLRERDVNEAAAARFMLGYAPAGANLAAFLRKRGHSSADGLAAGLLRRDGSDYFQQRVMIPIRDERGRTVAFTGRTVRSDENRKYVNTPETPIYAKGRVVFALDVARPAIEQRGHAAVMEGQFDVIAAHQAGVENAVASSGTALTVEQVRLLKRFTDELLLVFDNDRAGRSAAGKAVDLVEAEKLRVRLARLPNEAKDPDEFLRAGGDWDKLASQALPAREQLIRDRLKGLNPARPDDLERARAGVQAELDRISDPALWARYDELAKNLLNLDSRLQVFGRRQGTARAPQPQQGFNSAPAGNNVSKNVSYLLQALVVCPEAVEPVRKILKPDDLEEDDCVVYLHIVEALERGGVQELEQQMSSWPPAEQALVRRAWAEPLPGDALAVAEGTAHQIVLLAERRRRRGIINDLRDAERRGDMDEVSEFEQKLRRLATHE